MNPKELISQIKDYADIADASYAMLQYVWENIEQDEKNNIYKADKLTFGDKLKQDIVMKNSKRENIVKPKNTNTAYACAIQARFEQNKIVKIEPKYCISLINTCFDSKEITLDNDISRVGLNDALSKRTIDFVNRFKLLKHQPNTTNCLMKKTEKIKRS
ncbi:methyltransferase [Campylobacter lari]|uniref:methyltransferase n=1 Tax=Campylobacter lari TaxID=201 RepID=UPI0037278FED